MRECAVKSLFSESEAQEMYYFRKGSRTAVHLPRSAESCTLCLHRDANAFPLLNQLPVFSTEPISVARQFYRIKTFFLHEMKETFF